MMSGARLSGFAISFLLAAPGGAAAQDCGASELARELMKKIPSGASLALIPFGQPATAVPAEEAGRFYDCIVRSLQKASDGRHKFVARDRRNEIWKDWQSERKKSDYGAFWEKRKVGVTVRCKPPDQLPREGRLELSCTAHPVGPDSKLKTDVYGAPAKFEIGPLFGYRYALNQVALNLAGADPRPISEAFVTDAETGQRSKLTKDMGRRIRDVLMNEFRARRQDIEVRRNLGLEGEAEAGSYELRGEMTRLSGDTVALKMQLLEGRAEVAHKEVRIPRRHLPPLLVGTGTPRYSASARAVPSGDFRAESAKLAVKNAVRARVVAQASGLPMQPEEVRSEAEAIQALRWALERGLPAGERFSGPRKVADGAWEIGLEARVVLVGGNVRPEFGARLSKDALRANESFRIEFSARENVNVAVFAWGADGKVIRLYPHFREPEPMVRKDSSLTLPRDGECELKAEPLPGARESHEAVVVVAARKPMKMDGLPPPFCHLAGEKQPESVPGDDFLHALSNLDLSEAGLLVLPYRVGR